MTSLIYKNRTHGGEHGTVYTNKDTVYFMLDQIRYTSERDLSSLSVLDPCSGDGVFIICCLERLLESSKKYNFSFEKAFRENFLAIEIDDSKVQQLEKNIEYFFRKKNIIINNFKDILGCGDFLNKGIERKFDIVIGNPPYIRYDHIPDDMREVYKTNYTTFRGRCDIYIPFYEKGLSLLKKSGKLCYICSNRWLKNNYGANLRKLISSKYDFDIIINLEHIQVFEEDVIAYPAITIIHNSPTKNQTQYYEILDKEVLTTGGLSAHNIDNRYNFTILDELNTEKWSFGERKHVTFKSIEEQMFEIGIGPATGADRIFISKTICHEVEDSVLVPLILSKDLRGNNVSWSGNYLINPFEENGELIELSKYPKLNLYLNSHKESLLNRHITKRNPTNWYRTIDKIQASLMKKKKLIIPDTSSNEIILMEQGEYYPHHNLAYITHRGDDNLKILGAILSSDFGKNQMRKAGNLMNGGFIRWQIQNLRKITLPNIDTISEGYKKKIITAYEKKDIGAINISVNGVIQELGVD